MKSTLPALFRIHSKQKPKILALSPQKQAQYYTLNLTISHNYRTKIINPHHQKSDVDVKIPQRFKNPSKTSRYSQYPSRSLSVQQSYQHSLQPQSQTPSQHKTINPSTLHKPKYNIQQYDSIRIQIKKVKQQLFILKKSIQNIPQLHQIYLKQIKNIQIKINKQIDQTQKQIKNSIGKLWETLSSLRRQTNLQIRTMKRDLGIMAQQVQQEIDLIKDIEAQRATLKKIHF